METVVKNSIRKEMKKLGSHIGTVKSFLIANNCDFEIYRLFIEKEFAKKYSSVKTSIRKSVRYQ